MSTDKEIYVDNIYLICSGPKSLKRQRKYNYNSLAREIEKHLSKRIKKDMAFSIRNSTYSYYGWSPEQSRFEFFGRLMKMIDLEFSVHDPFFFDYKYDCNIDMMCVVTCEPHVAGIYRKAHFIRYLKDGNVQIRTFTDKKSKMKRLIYELEELERLKNSFTYKVLQVIDETLTKIVSKLI